VSKITCKFGGTSLADAKAIQRAADIVNANPERRFIVPSAPGKRHKDDRKVTDLLYAWHSIAQQGLDASEPRNIIGERFQELARALKVELPIDDLLKEITIEADNHATPDFMASRGEYLNGKLLALVLDAEFVDPQECILFTESGDMDDTTYEVLGARLQGDGRYVVPGFYGADPSGNIKTFSRGGSDITGAVVARASGSVLYENWTDVSGFCMADPRIIKNPRTISEITYQELRELSYMGATVLHDEAIFPVRAPGIPINIRNTMEPDHPGTRIVPKRKALEPVCGIAGKAGFSMINIEKAFMNKERGLGRRILTVLDEFGIAWEHMPTGIDTISLIVSDDELKNLGPKIVEEIKTRCNPDSVDIESGLAIIATVGAGMHHHIGVAAKLCSAIAEAGINLQVIDQGSSEMNIIIGVDAEDLERAVRAIYQAFVA